MLLVYTTVKSQTEAKKIGKKLVSDGLAACASTWKADSVYKWKGKIREESEWVIELKCRDQEYGKIEMALKKMHSYELPAIYGIPVAVGEKDYLKWLNKHVYLK